MSTVRLQLIDRNSKFPTVLKQKDNQIRQAENTFSLKTFYPESYEYLIVFYEFSITRSSIFEPDSHRISHPSFTRVPSSYFLKISVQFHFILRSKTK
jgi:hypothetical protein